MIKSFEDLDVFEKAYQISLEVHKKSLQFPAFEQKALADQLRRASKSICGNLAEGFGKQKRSAAEYCRFIQISIGSADEMRVWIRYCYDLGYIDLDQYQSWVERYREISRMLVGLHSQWKS